MLLGQLFGWRSLLAFHCGALLWKTMSQGLRLCSTEGFFLGDGPLSHSLLIEETWDW